MDHPLFTASIEWNRKVWLEYMGSIGTRGRRCFLFSICALSIFFVLQYFWIAPAKNRLIFCVLCLILVIAGEFKSWREYHKTLDRNSGKPICNLFSIRGEEIRCRNPVSGNEFTIAYNSITSIHRTKNQLVLEWDKQNGCIDLRTINGGTSEEMIGYILERSNVKKQAIPRRWNRRVLFQIYTVILVIGLLCSFPDGMSDMDFESQLSLNLQQAAQVLDELGITGISQELVWDLEADLDEYGVALTGYNAVLDLLYYAGASEYDPEDWSWIPSRNNVYTFDMEVWDVSTMYTDLLAGISAMSQNELVFNDVVEDDSLVNMEEGSGIKQISFTFRDKRVSLKAEMMYDWMDLTVLNSIADLVNDTDGEKKLYYMFTNSQMVSAFYCTEEWAALFRQKTGYTLLTTIPTY